MSYGLAEFLGLRRWKSTVKIGVFWDGPSYVLVTGTQFWVDLRTRLHLIRYPYRRATIEPVPQDEPVKLGYVEGS